MADQERDVRDREIVPQNCRVVRLLLLSTSIMGDHSSKNAKNLRRNLLQTWTYITEDLVTNEYYAWLLKELTNRPAIKPAWMSSTTHLLATSTAVSFIAVTDRSEVLHNPAIISLTTNHQKHDDASSVSPSCS
ncbi:ccd4c356-ca29-4785-adea-69b6e8929bab [Sclerotinia trifoliorum]|uniref:Ccd4c356-ca29-4785-adea-69b6e8929bab n=1 Tax=Sclerotinia trifoliorum TaxID=28548 RepID=A0A8H2W3N5_9HELO|nr:ccd4c356-ca29-4785-adea-69b6e8929bab [Sclerotinia trifoliorum]